MTRLRLVIRFPSLLTRTPCSFPPPLTRIILSLSLSLSLSLLTPSILTQMSVTQLEKTPTSTPTHDSLNAATTRSQSELEDDFGLGTPASTVHVPQDREIDSNNNNDAADDDEVDNKKLEYIEKEIPESIPLPQDIYPDGGLRAWLVVFGVRFCLIMPNLEFYS
ncbi:hypothetical protein H0H93_009641 [Arthromyces matolae]|nr:hypothetical protein H0H93_009641 [Arthromyces matolae]